MRRRGVGVSAVKKKNDETKKFQEVGKAMEENRFASIKESIDKFQKSLGDFAEQHRDKINSDPEFRQMFHTMCVSIGVDPLSSNKGFWADVLGVGNFYFELGIIVTQICLQTRSQNGGIMSMKELVQRLNNKKNLRKVGNEDVKRSIEKLSVLGNGFRLLNCANGECLVVSVPIELNHDNEDIMTAAQETGYVTCDMMQNMCGWSADRFHIAINPMLHEGIVWVDDYQGKTSSAYHISHISGNLRHRIYFFIPVRIYVGERMYWLPSIWKSMGMS